MSDNGGETTEGINNIDDSDLDSWAGGAASPAKKRKKVREAWAEFGGLGAVDQSSEHSFHSAKMVNGYQEFMEHTAKAEKRA